MEIVTLIVQVIFFIIPFIPFGIIKQLVMLIKFAKNKNQSPSSTSVKKLISLSLSQITIREINDTIVCEMAVM